MRIACPQCHESYAVSDEKLGGRVVQIRCKRCQAPIVLDGRFGAALAEAEPGNVNAPLEVHSGPSSAGARSTLGANTGSSNAPAPSLLGAAKPPALRRAPPPLPSRKSATPGTWEKPSAARQSNAARQSSDAAATELPLELEVDLDEVPPTARSSRYPAAPSTPPQVTVALPIVPSSRHSGVPPLPVPTGFAPTPLSGNAFPWLNAGRPSVSSRANEVANVTPNDAWLPSPRPETLPGTPSSLSPATKSPPRQDHSDSSAPVTGKQDSFPALQRDVSRDSVPEISYGTPPVRALAAREDDDTLAMTHHELMAAADRTSESRYSTFTRSSTHSSQRAATLTREQDSDSGWHWTMALLLVGAIAGGCGYLLFTSTGRDWLAQHYGTSLPLRRVLFAVQPATPSEVTTEAQPSAELETALVSAERNAANCLDGTHSAVHVRVAFRLGIVAHVKLPDGVPVAQADCIERTFRATTGAASDTFVLQRTVNIAP